MFIVLHQLVLRKAVVMLCMAVVALLSVQGTVAALDRIEHALEIEHLAQPLAGYVVSCAAEPSACAPETPNSPHPWSHVHFGDAAAYERPASLPSSNVAEFSLASFAANAAPMLLGLRPGAPDRPPKTAL